MISLKLKLKETSIKNILSYKNAKFTGFRNYNVLIGKNNSGKSNLFKIFELTKDIYDRGISEIPKSFIFDEDVNLEGEIKFKFEIIENFREEIFRILYLGKYLESVFHFTARTGGELPKKNWRVLENGVAWLKETNFFKNIIVIIAFINKRAYLSEILIEHDDIAKKLMIFQMRDNGQNPSHLNLGTFVTDRKSFKEIFTDTPLTKTNISSNFNLRSTLELSSSDQIKRENPILVLIFVNFINDFINSIYKIPDKRKFERSILISNISRTELEPSGENLVKFILMKLVTNQPEWLRHFKNELQYFIEDADNLRQNVDDEDNTVLILKEIGLKMDITLENMGAGILNVALFIAYIMELKENKILLIEEPELHLHPGLEQKLKQKFLEDSDKLQIFITTHSREFLAEENNEKSMFYLIKKENNQSFVEQPPEIKVQDVYDNLDIDKEKYKIQRLLLNDLKFWREFVEKAMSDKKIENNLWDFKQTLDMWRVDKELLELKKVDFCGDIISFANSDGGVLIIGISDKFPRKIIGLDDLENKVNQLGDLIKNKIAYPTDFIHFQQIQLKDKDGNKKNCLLIAVAQTADMLGVKIKDGTYLFKKRIGSSSKPVAPDRIEETKKRIYKDNFDFLEFIRSFTSNLVSTL